MITFEVEIEEVEIEREDDGRWIPDIAALPGVLIYGETPEEARAKAERLAIAVRSSA